MAGEELSPDVSSEFLAQPLTTELEWDELVLTPTTRGQLRELEAWINHERTLLRDWELAKRVAPGFRCLFHGSPGTGKTLTAALLGKRAGRAVYRSALATVVSKYIGETEKNLSRIFEQAERTESVLFFDEADALFGKRTEVEDAHDRYANQEVSYLLQRMERFAGVLIVATNNHRNFDPRFLRRFQSIVHFPMPGADERGRLWRAALSPRSVLEESVDLDELAENHELSGGAIVNVVRYASLMAIDAGSTVIRRTDLITAIRRAT